MGNASRERREARRLRELEAAKAAVAPPPPPTRRQRLRNWLERNFGWGAVGAIVGIVSAVIACVALFVGLQNLWLQHESVVFPVKRTSECPAEIRNLLDSYILALCWNGEFINQSTAPTSVERYEFVKRPLKRVSAFTEIVDTNGKSIHFPVGLDAGKPSSSYIVRVPIQLTPKLAKVFESLPGFPSLQGLKLSDLEETANAAGLDLLGNCVSVSAPFIVKGKTFTAKAGCGGSVPESKRK
jgi:hypothetical protein